MKKIITFSLCLIFRWGYSQILPTGVTMIPAYKGTHIMYCDSNNNLWNGNGTNGISKGFNSGIIFLSGKKITDIIEPVKGQIYFTSGYGLHHYNGTSMTTDGRIRFLLNIVNYKNRLHISTFGSKIYFQNGNAYDSLIIPSFNKPLQKIHDLYADNDYLWIGTNIGLYKYDGKNFKLYEIKSTSPNPIQVLSIEGDLNGNIWITNSFSPTDINDGNLYPIHVLLNDKLEPITNYYESDACALIRHLPIYETSKLYKKFNGNLTIVNSGKIFELSTSSIKHYIYNQETGLSMGPVIKNISFDRNNNMYLSDSNFYQIDFSQYSAKNYQEKIMPEFRADVININDIKASVGNLGTQFVLTKNLFETPLPGFQIPSTGCAIPMFTAGLWLGGIDDNNLLHQAAQTYSQTGVDYRPGPIDTVTLSYDSVNAIPFTHIWKINRSTIESFLANRLKSGYVIPDEILTWPAHGTGNFSRNLAPFVDTDSDGVYNPSKGDYPKIKGDQMLWWIFNDIRQHGETGGTPLQVEIQGSCYAYNCSKINPSDSEYILNRSIFFDYKIINRSKKNYTNFYVGLFNDADVGKYADDYVGCRADQNCGFAYNGDLNDEGEYGYGKNPPVLMCKLLNKKMSGFMYYNNNSDPINGNPNIAIDFYNYLNSKWQNGNNIRFGGNGVGGSINTNYMFDNGSNPATKFLPAWNEYTAGNSPGDRRFVMSAHDSVLKSGGVFDMEFSYIYVQDTGAITLQNFDQKPMQALRVIQSWYEQHNFPVCDQNNSGLRKTDKQMQNISVYPNPSNTSITISAAIPSEQIKDIQLMDISGRALMNIPVNAENGLLKTGMDISAIPAGVYIITIQTANGIHSIKVIKY